MLRPTTLLASLLLMTTAPLSAQDLNLPFEKHVLDNGLQVVIHEDHSDPVVAVYVIYHVGSGREEPGRSGFAHLFEHLMFQGSAHVGDDQHFKIVSEAGGSLNGTTNRDRTNYFETLPANQLETALWLEADRMGFLLPSVTQEKLDNQREVVKNERRQNYENVPYAQADERVMATLYPQGHPYSWLTIGSHEDLSAASLEDVHAFFRRWYGPNNATLAIGGDVDPAQALALARKYFGPIPRGPEVPRPLPRPTRVDHTVRLVMEDKVQFPQLSWTWPTVPRGHADEAALVMLGSILSANKAAILDKALTIDETLATRVSAGQGREELAAEFDITVRAAPDVSLDTLEARVGELLAGLARDGVDPGQLQRQKNRYESGFINGLETVAARTNALAEANNYYGDPAAATSLYERVMAVTPEQVGEALQRYVLGRACVMMSVVPEGRLELAASGRSTEQLAQETAFDRGVRPQPGAFGNWMPPAVWHDRLPSGVAVTGTPYTELPLVTLSLSVPGGHLRETTQSCGLASLTAQLMNEGTAGLTTIELQDRLDELGATLRVDSDDDELTVSLRTLSKHLPAAAQLMQDVLLEPRFDPADFERLKTQRLAALATRGDSIRAIAGNSWARVLFGRENLDGWPGNGTPDTVEALTLQDVKDFWSRHVVPAGARLVVVGDLDGPALRELLPRVAEEWTGAALPPIAQAAVPAIPSTRIFLVDKPGAPQSEIRIGHLGVSSLSPDWYPLHILNYVLGGGFSSRINMNLREHKGYTYGARTNWSGGLRDGPFAASAGVKTEVTKESVVEFMKELNAIRDGVTDEELAFARDALLQSMTRQYESVNALSGMLDSISRYGYPDDYLAQRCAQLQSITKVELDALADQYIHPDRMDILVVGDAESVRAGLVELGYGPVIELDIDGNPIEATVAP
ncbi:MAG TPA: pitrilysin family protein [Planctomycetota bacterium]|nr:pitrilysin family protein [Planctomycetota bacterium]